jgi:predicted phage-related endonuclease
MPRNPTLFTVTVPVTKKMMDLVIEASTHELDLYKARHYRACGLNANHIRRELANDEEIRAELANQILITAKEAVTKAIENYNISVRLPDSVTEALNCLDDAELAEGTS